MGLLKKTFWICISIFKCGIRIRLRPDLSSVRLLPIVKSGFLKFDRGGGSDVGLLKKTFLILDSYLNF